jgi:thioredoxin-dependent peroxiredoxin
MASLQPGDKVPSFTLQDQNGNAFNINDYIGKKKMVIYFYPKDESLVCTKEACSFRDSYADFTDANAIVVGVNSGSVDSHKAFAAKNRIPFTLLSDPGNKVLKQFGIKNLLFITGRETFVVDLDGKIAFSFRANMAGSAHAEKVLAFLKS